MRIERLDKRLEILEPILKEDGYGGMVTSYQLKGKLWAELKATAFREQDVQGTAMNQEVLRFRLRPITSLKRGWLIVYDGDSYVIESVDQTYRDSTTIHVRRYEQGV